MSTLWNQCQAGWNVSIRWLSVSHPKCIHGVEQVWVSNLDVHWGNRVLDGDGGRVHSNGTVLFAGLGGRSVFKDCSITTAGHRRSRRSLLVSSEYAKNNAIMGVRGGGGYGDIGVLLPKVIGFSIGPKKGVRSFDLDCFIRAFPWFGFLRTGFLFRRIWDPWGGIS